MSTSALWSWRSEGGRSLAFSAEDAATLEQDYLLHVFWGDDPEQKTETGWSKLPGDRVIDFARMRQLRPDAVGMFDSVMRSANTVGPTAVVSEGRYQAAELQIRTEGPAAPLFSPQPLVAACITGNAHDVRMLLLQFTEFANAIVDEKSQASVLHVAASTGHLAVVRCLTACGAGIEARTKAGAAPIHAAAQAGASSVVEFFASVGANVEAKTADGAVPLHIASQHGHEAIVRYLIEEKRSDPNVTNDAGVTPLILACETGHTAVLLQLVAAGAHVNHADKEGITPLHAACHFGHTEAVYALLTAGAEYETVNVNARSLDGLQPLFSAAQRGSTVIAKLLLSAGAHHEPKYGEGDHEFTGAEAAQYNSHAALAEMLTDGSLLTGGSLLEQLAGMGNGSSDDEGAGPKYSVVKKVAVYRNFEDTGSRNRSGWLEEGMIVSALETRGQGSAELRIYFEHETIGGWASCQRSDGTLSLRLMGSEQQTLEGMYSGQSLTPSLDLFESSGHLPTTSIETISQNGSFSVSPRTFAATGPSISSESYVDGNSLSLTATRKRMSLDSLHMVDPEAVQMTPDDFGSPRATALGSYRALRKLKVHQSRELNSKKKGSLAAGTVIKALEITDVTTSKGLTQTRLLYSGGWVSMRWKDGTPALEEVESLQPWETPVAERSRFGSNGSSSSSAWRQPSGGSVGVPPLRLAGGIGGSMEQRRPNIGALGSSSTRSASDSGFTVTSTSTERTGSRIGSSRIGSASSVWSESRRLSATSLSSDSGRPSSASSSLSPSHGRTPGSSPMGAHPSYAGGGQLGEIPRSAAPHAVGSRHDTNRHTGQHVAVDVPPPPSQAPPPQVIPPGAKHFALQVEPHETLLPTGRRLQIAAVDLAGLTIEIGRQLGLRDLRLQFFDDDFGEWCALASLEEMDGDSLTRLKITAGNHLAAAHGSTGDRQQATAQPQQYQSPRGWDSIRHSMKPTPYQHQHQPLPPRMRQIAEQQRHLQQVQTQQHQLKLQQQRQLLTNGGGSTLHLAQQPQPHRSFDGGTRELSAKDAWEQRRKARAAATQGAGQAR